MIDPHQLEPQLTEQDIALRDAFVSHYLTDFNAFTACIKLGFLPHVAIEQQTILLHDGYVQRKLEFLLKQPVDSEADIESDKVLVANRFRHTTKTNAGAAGVAAAKALAEMRGFMKPDAGVGAESALVEVFRDLAQKLPA